MEEPLPETAATAYKTPVSPSVVSCIRISDSMGHSLEQNSLANEARNEIKLDIEAQQSQQKRPGRIRDSYYFLRYTALNVYRRLFSIVFISNMAVFIAIMITDRSLLAFVNATAANLTACGLARQPLVVNSIYRVVCSVPRSAPLRIRQIAAKAFHFGGVHSGCGVASLLWYVGLVVLVSLQYWAPVEKAGEASVTLPTAVVVLAYVILILLLSIVIVAHPTFRSRLHDYFELTHRFLGWTVVILFLALLLVFSDNARSQSGGRSLGQYLIRLPAFWLLFVVITAIIHPYLLLRKVHVRAESLSKHAIRLHMDHTTTKFGKGIQLSKHPLRDWHSFATFPDSPKGDSFSSLVSKAGDWTSDIIANPPTHLWKRGVLLYGFGYVMGMFNRIIVVTTGSGIGPCLSFLGDEARPAMRVLWQTRSPLQTYGQGILDLVKDMDPDPLVMDTNKTGRIDMVPVIEQLVHEFRAEAVCVISNAKLTKKLVFELETRGVVAMGPIFDS
ncbi:hypothetical protein PISL3812_03354 [Talaromyces islandicus]|uniref:Integral membrane protein TmpA n=1 Tax=Talaromyces islandicus TaxID=28573 RepID=A0A0U1LSI0_TALIS|nr:hypothetical protein PISL3812_03354 [Talaromyces islandicus]